MKKWLSMLLALALCLTVVAVPAMADAAATDVHRFDEPITLSVSIFDRGATGETPVDNNYWTKWIQQNFGDPRNITIKWVVIPRSEEVDKLNTLMASGEAADISFTYTESVVTNFVQQGGLVDLGQYIDQYGSNIKSFVGDDVMSAGIFDGKQYAIPARRVVLATTGMFIREDWLDALGLKMPTTKDEFYNDLVAFRDKNPGKVDGGCIPYAATNDLTGLSPLIYSFIKNIGDDKMRATAPDITWDGYEDYVVFMNKLYNEGLISPDFALDTSNQDWAAVTSGKAGGYTANYDHPIRVSPGILSSLQAYAPDAKLSPLNCFESVTDNTKYYHGMYSAYGIFNIVPTYCQHPDAAVMYLDWLSQYENIYYLQNGIEGVTYNLNSDGVPVLIDVQDEHKFNSMQNLDYTLTINGQYLDDPAKLLKAQATSYQNYADLFEAEYNVGNTDPIQTSFHFDTILSAEAQYGTSLTAFKKEMLTKAVMAKPEDCKATFESLRDEYMSMGGTDVMNEKVAAWDKMHTK